MYFSPGVRLRPPGVLGCMNNELNALDIFLIVLASVVGCVGFGILFWIGIDWLVTKIKRELAWRRSR